MRGIVTRILAAAWRLERALLAARRLRTGEPLARSLARRLRAHGARHVEFVAATAPDGTFDVSCSVALRHQRAPDPAVAAVEAALRAWSAAFSAASGASILRLSGRAHAGAATLGAAPWPESLRARLADPVDTRDEGVDEPCVLTLILSHDRDGGVAPSWRIWTSNGRRSAALIATARPVVEAWSAAAAALDGCDEITLQIEWDPPSRHRRMAAFARLAASAAGGAQ